MVSRVTLVRQLIVVACFLTALLMYLDRVCVSTIDRLIRDDLALHDAQMDWFKGIFFLTYALGQVPAGWLADRFGARAMMTAYIVVWSLLMAAMGWAQSFWMLLLARAGYGLAQAGGYPTAASLVGRWAPVDARGAASAFVSFGGRFGGVLAPVLTAGLVVLLLPGDWQPEFTPGDLRQPAALVQAVARSAAEIVPRAEATASLGPTSSPGAPQSPGPRRPRDWTAELAAKIGARAPISLRDQWQTSGAISDAAEYQDVVDLLNACLSAEDLVDADLADRAPLSPAARELLARPAGMRTSTDQARLNRLVLETAFPTALRSSYRSAWRPVMWLYGACGLLIGGLFWCVARESPAVHPWCHAAAASQASPMAHDSGSSAAARGSAIAPRRGGIPWSALASSRSLWMISLSQFGTNIGWAFVVTSFPRFLDERFHVPFTDASQMQSMVLLVGIAGTLLGGTLTDALVRRAGVYWGRMLPMSVTRLVCAAACATCVALDSPWAVTAALALMALFTDLGMAAIWGFSQDVGGRQVGSVLGWGNMWGNLGAFMSPLVIGSSVQALGWEAAFWICAAAFLVAGVSGMYVDARRPIVAPGQ